jgi:glycosyltransferase involved in cell wall biosynthesis
MNKINTYWLITTEFPPIHGGGISTYAYHTAQMLHQNGIKVTVFIQDFDINGIKEKTYDLIRIIRFNPSQIATKTNLGYEANLSYSFAEVIKNYIHKEGKPDIIESQDYQGIGYYLQQRKLTLESDFQGIPILVTMHAPSFLYLEYNQVSTYKFPEFWIGEMEKSSIRSADILISPSKYLVDELEPRLKLNDKSTTVVPNPFKPSRGIIYLDYKFKKNDLVFFGKLIPQKGCIEMLSYFKTLWDNGFEHSLRVIGGGDHFFYPVQMDMNEYFNKKYSKYIEKGLLKFEGKLKPDKAMESLLKAHIVIVPSIVDNLPYAVLEAMSLGKVVLGSDKSGHIELIEHGESGFIFTHDNVNNFGIQLNKILSLDKNEIARIGKNAANRVYELTNYKKVFAEKMDLISKLNTKTENVTFPYIRPISRKHTLKTINTKKPGLTVLIPYYNMGDFIKETVVSVVNSSLKPTRIIIVNDGSTEKSSLDKLNELDAKYPIEIINKHNTGLAATRNFAAKLVKTEFMAFLDADDCVMEKYYEKAVSILKKYENVSFVGCWAQYFGESDDVWPAFNPEPPYLLAHNTINSSGLIYKTNDFMESGFNDSKMIYGMEDYDSVISMVSNGYQGIVIPEKLWKYRIRSNSMAQSFTRDSELYLYRLIAAKHREFFAEYNMELVNILNANGPGINYDNPTWSVPTANGISLPDFNSKLMNRIKNNAFLRKVGKKIYVRLMKL